MVVLKNCGPEISYILAKLFSIGLRNLIFQIAGRSHLWSLYLRMLGEMSVAKNYCPVVSRLSAVSKVFEKLVNNRIADHLKKCFLFSAFQYGFRSSRSSSDLLAVVSDRIARSFNRSRATQAMACRFSS